MKTSRLQDLWKVQCRIFSHVFNPTHERLGSSVLRQRLKGPSMAAYYPRRLTSIKALRKGMRENMPHEDIELWDDAEEDRVEHVLVLKQRGKGAPKKKRSAEESKKAKKKKKA